MGAIYVRNGWIQIFGVRNYFFVLELDMLGGGAWLTVMRMHDESSDESSDESVSLMSTSQTSTSESGFGGGRGVVPEGGGGPHTDVESGAWVVTGVLVRAY